VPGSAILSRPTPADELQAGDVVIVSSQGFIFSAYRRVTGCTFDHVVSFSLATCLEQQPHTALQGLVVAPGIILHVGPPRTRILPTHTIFSRRRRVEVLRPILPGSATAQQAARGALCAASVQLVGEKYANLRALGALSRLAIDHAVGGSALTPLMAPGGGIGELTAPRQHSELAYGRWLCSDAIMYVQRAHASPHDARGTFTHLQGDPEPTQCRI
jgi:hypothetical protein